MTGTLYLVPNLLGLVAPEAVLPAGTIEVARKLRHFVVENAKPARQFLKTLAIDAPLQQLAIETLPAVPDPEICRALLAPARRGEAVGLVSDAGCPGVADPGAALVAEAHDSGIRVVPLVGPSALLLGLMASGLNGQAFCFHGYLPVEAAPREEALRYLEEDLGRRGVTHLFIETPYRNEAMITSILRVCRPTTRLCVAADLTLSSEWIVSAPIAAWRAREHPALAKRPALFLIGRTVSEARRHVPSRHVGRPPTAPPRRASS